MIKITVSRSVFEWLYYDVFPTASMMAEARVLIQNETEVEYWVNVIVKHVLKQVCSKFSKKEHTASKTITVKLEVAEAFTLFRFLDKYPIQESEHWKKHHHQSIIASLHQQIISTETVKG